MARPHRDRGRIITTKEQAGAIRRSSSLRKRQLAIGKRHGATIAVARQRKGGSERRCGEEAVDYTDPPSDLPSRTILAALDPSTSFRAASVSPQSRPYRASFFLQQSRRSARDRPVMFSRVPSACSTHCRPGAPSAPRRRVQAGRTARPRSLRPPWPRASCSLVPRRWLDGSLAEVGKRRSRHQRRFQKLLKPCPICHAARSAASSQGRTTCSRVTLNSVSLIWPNT